MEQATRTQAQASRPFEMDVKAIRAKARQDIESGAVTDTYRADRQTVGHVLFARRDNVAVMVSLTGIHAENPKLFERKLEPELEKLSHHDPR